MSQFTLVYVPADIRNIRVFTPKRTLAVMAQILQDNNIDADIHDFGIPEAIQYLSHYTIKNKINNITEHKVGSWFTKLLGKEKNKKGVKDNYLQWVYRNLEISSQTICLLFWIENREELIIARTLANEIRESKSDSKLCIVGVGPYFNYTGPYVMTHLPEFNGILINHYEMSLLPLWEHIVLGKSVDSIPNYVYMEGGEIHVGPVNLLLTLDELPIPSYETYHSLLEGSKFNIFTLEQVRNGKTGYSEPYRLKQYINSSVNRLLEEIANLRERYNTWTFHIDNEMPSSEDVQAFSLALLKSSLFITYSRVFHCLNIQGDWVHSLHLSGCRAISVHVPTGSQRLLSKYYGCMRTISSLETAISAFVGSNFYTSIQCTYPCPEEDRHTFAETLRFIERVKPDTVRVSSTSLWPDSTWWENLSSFNFDLNPSDYFSWLAGEQSSKNYLHWKPFDTSIMENKIVELNITPQSSELMGIILQVLQISKEQKFFKQSLEKILLEGDADSLQDIISQFNAQLKKQIREEEWNLRKYDYKSVAN